MLSPYLISNTWQAPGAASRADLSKNTPSRFETAPQRPSPLQTASTSGAVPGGIALPGSHQAQTLIRAQELGHQDTGGNRQRSGAPLTGTLTPEEKAAVERLQRQDAKVRAHERAHENAAGPYAGAARYQYVTGPDGRRYAVSSEVPIDTSDAGSPEATIAKLETVVRATLAPVDPSAQDRAVAQEARRRIREAEAEAESQENEEARGGDVPNDLFTRGADAYARAQVIAEPVFAADVTTRLGGVSLYDFVA